MTKIAVDVAILPPEEIMDVCIRINKADPNAHSALNKEDNFPHISLYMGVIDDKQMAEIKEVIESILSKFRPLRLELSGFEERVRSDKSISISIKVERTEKIQKLHEMVMKKMAPFVSYDVEPSMLHDKDIDAVSMHWIQYYKEKSSGKNFRSHISLKCSKGICKFPVMFTADRLALCHMGKSGTCRKILFESKIKKI